MDKTTIVFVGIEVESRAFKYIPLAGTKAWPKKLFLIKCHRWMEGSSNQYAALKCSRLAFSLAPDSFNSQALFYGILCLENYCLCVAICGLCIFHIVFFFFEGGGLYLANLITLLPQGIFTLSAFQVSGFKIYSFFLKTRNMYRFCMKRQNIITLKYFCDWDWSRGVSSDLFQSALDTSDIWMNFLLVLQQLVQTGENHCMGTA